LFIDAGNIWLLKENADKPGAKLSKDFMNELAVGVGAGLRFDFSFLVYVLIWHSIRKPYLADGNRWVLDKVILVAEHGVMKSRFNLAIGYPF
jgi:outer membrane protein assembly factor BamA